VSWILVQKLLLWGLRGTLLCLLLALLGNGWVWWRARACIVRPEEADQAQVAIVPGAYVYNNQGKLCPVLEDRVRAAISLYRQGTVGRLLMSGDHGQDGYDEVNSMRIFAEQHGVPREDIFLDHAGFSTYETMVRARRIFQVESAVVVTNRFHLARSVYLARSQGIRAQGVVADLRPYLDAGHYEVREFAARMKALISCHLISPNVLSGPPIPITGPASASHDQT
jgi:SanA protein